MALILINVRALLPDGTIARVELRAADGHIAEIAPRLGGAAPRLDCDTRVHLRFEQFNVDAAPEIEGWIERGLIDLLAFNEHTADIGRQIAQGKLASYCARTGLDEAAFTALFHQVCGRAAEVPA